MSSYVTVLAIPPQTSNGMSLRTENPPLWKESWPKREKVDASAPPSTLKAADALAMSTSWWPRSSRTTKDSCESAQARHARTRNYQRRCQVGLSTSLAGWYAQISRPILGCSILGARRDSWKDIEQTKQSVHVIPPHNRRDGSPLYQTNQ